MWRCCASASSLFVLFSSSLDGCQKCGGADYGQDGTRQANILRHNNRGPLCCPRRRERNPQPWVVRKLMVVVTLGIMGYTAYVYAGRFFVRLKDGGRRPAGVGLLVGWTILYLWTLWAYIKVILTPPGNACDYAQKTPQPLLERPQWGQPPQDSADSFDSRAAALTDIETGRIGATREIAIPDGPLPVYIPGRNGLRQSRGRFPTTAPPAASLLLALLDREAVSGAPFASLNSTITAPGSANASARATASSSSTFASPPSSSPSTPLSLFGFNRGSNMRVGRSDGDVDPQEVVIIALTALFFLFTASLGVAHSRMILLSQTTVENLNVQRLKERDGAGLEEAGIRCWEVATKRRVIAAYDAEWGRPDTEGNVWWAGERAQGVGGRDEEECVGGVFL
ncbi:Palmitoyltransferase [Mycena venus]|uniref:Palmitoyltransferase n=1 Tax=Mycena venus TaxID=2733690 RepID=A0A8H6YZ69_9AGAR|nr:Palmitoyltransferase [Mycena venus]